jgi:hypothetical protein
MSLVETFAPPTPRAGFRLAGLGIVLFGLSAATEWEAKYLVDEDKAYCSLSGRVSDGSLLSFFTMKIAQAEVGVSISNPSWTFVEDQLYPNVVLGTEDGSFSPATARGNKHGVILTTSRSFMAAFVNEGVTEDGRLTVLLGDKVLATFPLEGMRSKYEQFVACDTIKFRDPTALPKDPFKP